MAERALPAQFTMCCPILWLVILTLHQYHLPASGPSLTQGANGLPKERGEVEQKKMWGVIFSSMQTLRLLVKRLRDLFALTSNAVHSHNLLVELVHSFPLYMSNSHIPFFFFLTFAASSWVALFWWFILSPAEFLYSADLQARLITPRSLINSFCRSCLEFSSATSWLPLQTRLPVMRFPLCWIARYNEFPSNPTGCMWLRYCRNS